eukprot:TRINITY_DN113_c2_g1_i1.p1 TRINITY_DN113_c2_g1~~TRINITY_DN113_c2_g1_i1.p1  ORF type:complete len:276 (-),score=14.57 TRINITY_DN113_c2_g1_i1:649-1476(-)
MASSNERRSRQPCTHAYIRVRGSSDDRPSTHQFFAMGVRDQARRVQGDRVLGALYAHAEPSPRTILGIRRTVRSLDEEFAAKSGARRQVFSREGGPRDVLARAATLIRVPLHREDPQGETVLPRFSFSAAACTDDGWQAAMREEVDNHVRMHTFEYVDRARIGRAHTSSLRWVYVIKHDGCKEIVYSARSMLMRSRLPEQFWGYAVQYAAWTRNLQPRAALGGKCSAEKAGRGTYLRELLRSFGCRCIVKIPKARLCFRGFLFLQQLAPQPQLPK